MEIKNKFLDLIVLFLSFFINIFRSIFIFFGIKNIKQKGIFFRVLNFLFEVWPKYFWKKPDLFKITSFIGAFIRFVFYNKK